MDPVNIPVKFEVPGLRTPNLGEGEAVGGRDGTVRKSVRDFL